MKPIIEVAVKNAPRPPWAGRIPTSENGTADMNQNSADELGRSLLYGGRFGLLAASRDGRAHEQGHPEPKSHDASLGAATSTKDSLAMNVPCGLAGHELGARLLARCGNALVRRQNCACSSLAAQSLQGLQTKAAIAPRASHASSGKSSYLMERRRRELGADVRARRCIE
jgi:hypothetical protein